MKAGADYKLAAEVGQRVEKYLKTTNASPDKVKSFVFKFLSEKNPVVARNFKDKHGMYVRTSKETFEPFDRKYITNSVVLETGVPKEIAERIAYDVEEKLKKMNPKYITSAIIREMVNLKMMDMGLEDAGRYYSRVGLPIYDITQLISNGSNENANLQRNPETIHKLMADEMLRQYALTKVLHNGLADAHLRGLIHVHDLDYFAMRPFCFSHDLRFFLKRGYVADGEGFHTAAAAPAKHANVAVLHAAKALASAQTNYAGGQGYNWFNVFLAPYARGLQDKEVKQMAQMFIYEMSQMYVARGGQVVFSSIDLYPTVPKALLDVPAVGPGGKTQGVYGDYDAESRRLFNAFMDVYLEGDAMGKPFNFPKPEVVTTPKWMKEYPEEYTKVSQLSAKFGSPYYFVHQSFLPEMSCYQCCAYLMPLSDQNDKTDLYEGTVRGGALQVTTINLPRVAYDADGNDDMLFELLRDRMVIARKVLEVKRALMHQVQDSNLLPFMNQKVRDNEAYLQIDRQSLVIGMVGLNEMVKYHTGKELHEDPNAWKFGLKVFNFMRGVVDDFKKETGLNYSLARTPAESCSQRLANIDVKEFGEKAIVQGDRKTRGIYYTNGFHVRPSADIPLWKRMQIETSFHPICTGGVMSHIWLGEAQPNAEALFELTKKLIDNTLITYFAYTKDMSICRKCRMVMPGMQTTCSSCGATGRDIDWWSRITGYYQNVSSWNEAKRQELLDRKRYTIIGPDL